MPDRIARAAKGLGYPELRPGQHEAISAVVDGRDTLAILPTGSGKSAIYQVAGLLLEGTTIVVSPLVALQRDQEDRLTELGLHARALNSGLGAAAREEVFAALHDGTLECLASVSSSPGSLGGSLRPSHLHCGLQPLGAPACRRWKGAG